MVVQHCPSGVILEKKVPFENSVSGYCSRCPILPLPLVTVINIYIRTWELYIGSNDLSQVLCQHHQMHVPGVIHTFIHLFFLFSFLEDRLKNEAFRPLQDVIQGTSSHVLASLWKRLPPVEASTTQGQAEE